MFFQKHKQRFNKIFIPSIVICRPHKIFTFSLFQNEIEIVIHTDIVFLPEIMDSGVFLGVSLTDLSRLIGRSIIGYQQFKITAAARYIKQNKNYFYLLL